MKIKSTILISLVIILQGSFVIPTNALFGIGACERANKAIIAEEKIGFESWKYYRQMVTSHNRDASWNNSLAEALAEIYKSDKIVWTIARKNSKCYSPSQVAEVRRQLSYTQRTLSDYEKLIKNPNFETAVVDWSIYYQSYDSAISILEKAKKSKK